MELGLEHPGKQLTRTGTSGGAVALDWNIRGRDGPGQERPGLQKEEEAAAARSGKENTNKSKKQWRERTRRTTVRNREEKEKKE